MRVDVGSDNTVTVKYNVLNSKTVPKLAISGKIHIQPWGNSFRGDISVDQYPSFELYQYVNGQADTLVQHSETEWGDLISINNGLTGCLALGCSKGT